MAGIELTRVEEAGLNALQTQRQLFYDGWLLRVSPGTAKRARSINPYFGSTLSLDLKIDRCERLYASHGLPALFRITPFIHPTNLERALEERGYVVFQPTYVQLRALDRPPEAPPATMIELATPPIDAFVNEVAALRGSSEQQRAAHLARHRRAVGRPHDRLRSGCARRRSRRRLRHGDRCRVSRPRRGNAYRHRTAALGVGKRRVSRVSAGRRRERAGTCRVSKIRVCDSV